MKPLRTTSTVSALAICLSPAVAQAHPGHGAEFSGGLIHPLLGWDHLLVMVAIGLWAAQLGGRARWTMPGAFVTAVVFGAAAGIAGLRTPLAEPMIVASVMILGLLIASAARLQVTGSVALVSVFAFFHGVAHGTEFPTGTSAWIYIAGLSVATLALHGLGLIAGSLAIHRARVSPLLRFAGASVALAGALAALRG